MNANEVDILLADDSRACLPCTPAGGERSLATTSLRRPRRREALDFLFWHRARMSQGSFDHSLRSWFSLDLERCRKWTGLQFWSRSKSDRNHHPGCPMTSSREERIWSAA